MAGRPALIAALSREVRGLVRGIRPEADLLARGIQLYRMPEAVVVAAGMGAARVMLGVEAAVASGEVSELISIGLAGSCSSGLAPGAVVEADEVLDAQTGERYRTSMGGDGPLLVSTDTIASVREKARLAASYGAALVDMEAATVGRLARAHGLRFRAIKGISDAHDFELASLGRFTGERGQFRTAAFALHTALRPATWGQTVQLGRNSQRALAALCERVKAAVAAS